MQACACMRAHARSDIRHACMHTHTHAHTHTITTTTSYPSTCPSHAHSNDGWSQLILTQYGLCVPETEVEKLKKAVDTLMVSNEDKVSVVMRTLIVSPSVVPSTLVLLVYPT